jgi:hypothetical protein
MAIALLASRNSAASPAAHDRIAHIDRALAAVRALGPAGRDALDRDVYTVARTRCHADTGTPTADCLIDAARAQCATSSDRASCEAAADVVAANLRSTSDFVDDATRVRLVRGSTDYRAALAGELRKRYALLAAELALASAGTDAAAVESAGFAGARSDAHRRGETIDRFCRDRDLAIHSCAPGDAACLPSLAWSRCVAALVWFIGGTP